MCLPTCLFQQDITGNKEIFLRINTFVRRDTNGKDRTSAVIVFIFNRTFMHLYQFITQMQTKDVYKRQTYTLEKEAAIDDICIKLNGWRSRSYPLEVFAGNTMIWSGDTNKSLGYVHLNVEKPVRSKQITIRLKGNTSDQDAFGQITEVAAKAANDMELEAKANKNNANLRIIEIEFLEAIK